MLKSDNKLDVPSRSKWREEEGELLGKEMSSLGTSKGILEIVKFAIYVAVPISLTYAVVTDSKTIHKLMGFVCSLFFSPFALSSFFCGFVWLWHEKDYSF